GRLNIHDNGRCATLVSEDDEAVVYRLPSGGTIRLGKRPGHKPACRCARCVRAGRRFPGEATTSSPERTSRPPSSALS
ncbi:MAG: hypothetical protein ACREB9_04920, partial [Thermoplasmata archaeon]